MKKLFYLVVFILGFTCYSQTPKELFIKANSFYKKGNYKEAIELYEEIEKTNKVSSELFYNLANSYYKLNKVGPSVYNYERALKLDPSNEDARNNLVFAKRLSLDRIESLPKSFLQKFNQNYISKINYNQWAIISIILSFIASLLFLLYYFTNISSRKKLFFSTSIITLILLVISLSIAFHQFNKKQNTVEAIVYSSEVSIKNEPTVNANESFVLHEGTKVFVLDSVDDWKKIRLSDGKIGWLKNKEIKIVY